MKKLYITAIAIFLGAGLLFAQNESDALRYTQLFPMGTARTMSMGGAFGAFGGDFSTLSINPAGIGVYRSSEFTVTPSFNYSPTESTYLGNTTGDLRSNFFLGNLGYVYSHLTGKKTGLVAVNFGAGYNRENDFNSNLVISGTNNSNSMLDYFAYMAYNQDPSEFSDFEEGLAWDAYLIDEYPAGSYNYETVLSDYGNAAGSTYGMQQRRELLTGGGMGEYVFSLGANISNMFYIGGTFGVHKLNYRQRMYHSESDEDNSIDQFDYFNFNESLDVWGKGYSFKMGFLMKPIQMIRLGGAVHIPFNYKISEDYSTNLEAGFDSPRSDGESYYDLYSSVSHYDYRITTPLKAVANAGVQLFKIALVSADVEYVNYSGMRMRTGGDGYNFMDENDAIREAYRDVLNYRAGAELRVSHFSIRAGASFNESPYKETEANKDAYTYSYSAGFGYRESGFFIDMAYVYINRQKLYYMYPYSDIQPSVNNLNRHTILATIGVKF